MRTLISDDKDLSENDITTIMYWTALHSIRNINFRENSGKDYNAEFDELLKIEKLFTNYFRYIFTYDCTEEEFFITSDNPILEFYVGKNILRVLTWSPDKAILFSPIDDWPTHPIKFSKIVNSMLFSTATNEVFSNKRELPIKRFKKDIERYNLKPNFETTQFYLKNR